MTRNQREAVAQLVALHRDYTPLFDALLAATEETVGQLIEREQKMAARIIHYAKIAFGPTVAHGLEFFKPIDYDNDEIATLEGLKAYERRLSDAHFGAMQGCHIRAVRLGRMLQDDRLLTRTLVRAPEIRAAWLRMLEERGTPRKRGEKAARLREIGEQLGVEPETVKSAVRRG